MVCIFNNQQYLNKPILSAVLAAALLYLYSFWVPFSDGFYYEWLQGNLFHELQPRAFLGTIANLLHFSDYGLAFIKITSLWAWLTLIIWQITQYVSGIFNPKKFFCLLSISFLFAFSTVSLMSFGPVMFIDVIPYLLVLIAYLNLSSDRVKPIGGYFISPILLIVATLIHEKSIFDMGILTIWFAYKRELKKIVFGIFPSLLVSALFLFSLRNKSLTGESLNTYLSVLHEGANFLANSFSFWEVMFGLGALGVLYIYLAFCLIKKSSTNCKGIISFAVTLGMLLNCIAPLTVAWDTNRLVGLIWLPTLILLKEVKSFFINPNFSLIIFLSLLCIIQLAIPPILRFPPAVVIAYNAYAKSMYGEKAIQLHETIRQRETLFFRDQSKGSNYLIDGWAGPESWGVWSNQRSSIIGLENLDPRITLISIQFNAMASMHKPIQNLTIYANDYLVSRISITNFHDNTIEFRIPDQNHRSLKIRFEVDALQSPVELGISGNDHRLLGIGLVKMDLK